MTRTQPVARFVRSGMKRNCASPPSPHGTGFAALGRVDVRADVLPQVGLQHVEQRQEDRQLRHHREARGERVHLVLPVEAHHLLVEALLVVLVLLLELLDLRLQPGHRLHRLELLERQRQQREPHERGSAR